MGQERSHASTASRYNEVMNVETRPYVERSSHYLTQASEEFAQGDYLQASEKGWGATAQMIKAVAEERGWDHSRHAQLIGTVRQVVEETGDQELWLSFGAARDLHENFYEEQMGAGDVEFHLDQVRRLTDRLRALIDGD